MRFAERAQYFFDPGIWNIVFHVAGTVPCNLVSFFFRQAEIQLIGNNGVIIKEILDFRFNSLNQMILCQVTQSGITSHLNFCFSSLFQFITGQFKKPVSKHPIPGSRHVQRIAHIKENDFFIFQQINHALLLYFRQFTSGIRTILPGNSGCRTIRSMRFLSLLRLSLLSSFSTQKPDPRCFSETARPSWTDRGLPARFHREFYHRKRNL